MTPTTELLATVSRYYTGRLHEHGPTARGVDWNSPQSQQTRFEQLLRVCEPDRCRILGDFGCGYGALYSHLQMAGSGLAYRGFDIAEAMIASARGVHGEGPDRRFGAHESILEDCDVVVASGVFNVKLATSIADWDKYLYETLDRLADLGPQGFAFNALTSYSDPERMRDTLYYADPCRLFDHCKRRYSRHVALLHDYGLWEFTILVRKA